MEMKKGTADVEEALNLYSERLSFSQDAPFESSSLIDYGCGLVNNIIHEEKVKGGEDQDRVLSPSESEVVPVVVCHRGIHADAYDEEEVPDNDEEIGDDDDEEVIYDEDGIPLPKQTRKSKPEQRNEQGEKSKESSEQAEEFELSKYMCTAADLVEQEEYLSTGCPNLDVLFRGGGIPTFGVTELYGEAGSGKTQLCLQLAITAQLPRSEGGLDAGCKIKFNKGEKAVLYVCTEEAFPSVRLNQLVTHFKEKFPTSLPENPMDNIFVDHLGTADDLMTCLDVKLQALVRSSPRKKVRLVILDSVAGIFRIYSEDEDWGERTRNLRRLGQTLHEFAFDHKAAIVACNQITSNIDVGGDIAALGLSWRNLITTRIQLTKPSATEYRKHRSLRVNFSPHIPQIPTTFHIDTDGVRGDPKKASI